MCFSPPLRFGGAAAGRLGVRLGAALPRCSPRARVRAHAGDVFAEPPAFALRHAGPSLAGGAGRFAVPAPFSRPQRLRRSNLGADDGGLYDRAVDHEDYLRATYGAFDARDVDRASL